MHIYIYAHTHIYTYTYIHIHKHMHIHVSTCSQKRVCELTAKLGPNRSMIHTHINSYTYIHTYIHRYTDTHKRTYHQDCLYTDCERRSQQLHFK